VRGSFAQPSSAPMRRMLPPFLREPAPLAVAIDAIERGVERRSARVWAPATSGRRSCCAG
jgi:hypothetical protein